MNAAHVCSRSCRLLLVGNHTRFGLYDLPLLVSRSQCCYQISRCIIVPADVSLAQASCVVPRRTSCSAHQFKAGAQGWAARGDCI